MTTPLERASAIADNPDHPAWDVVWERLWRDVETGEISEAEAGCRFVHAVERKHGVGSCRWPMPPTR